MDKTNALTALSALSQPLRLDAFRLLIQAGQDGMAAGDIAATLDVKQNTMSANLSVLHQAGLIRNLREGRSIRYFAHLDGIRGLLGFLMEDCCGGQPDQCQPLLKQIAPETPPPHQDTPS